MACAKSKSKNSSKRNENRTTLLAFLAAQEKRKHRVLVPKRSLQGEPLPPMPPASGELTVELRHKSETHIGAAICSAAWGALCRRVRFCRLTARKRRVRPPWRREENRIKNFDWVILLGHAKTNFAPQNGEQCEERKCAGRKIGLAIRLCLW